MTNNDIQEAFEADECLQLILDALGIDDLNINSRGLFEGYIRKVANQSKIVDVEALKKVAFEWLNSHSDIGRYPLIEDLVDYLAELGYLTQHNDKATTIEESPFLRQHVNRYNLEQPVPEGWQPIDTAPKDGTFILVYEGKKVSIVKWVEGDDLACGAFFKTNSVFYHQKELTHWMPLPPAPKPKEEEMYHEETIIDGVLHFRGRPDALWKKYTPEQLTNLLINARKDNDRHNNTKGGVDER